MKKRTALMILLVTMLAAGAVSADMGRISHNDMDMGRISHML